MVKSPQFARADASHDRTLGLPLQGHHLKACSVLTPVAAYPPVALSRARQQQSSCWLSPSGPLLPRPAPHTYPKRGQPFGHEKWRAFAKRAPACAAKG